MELFSPGGDVERVLFVAGCAYLFLSVCLLLWWDGLSAWSSGPGQWLLQRMVVPLRRARGTLEPGWHEGVNSDVQHAAQELQRRKIALTKALLPYANCAGVVVIAAMWWGGTLPMSFAQSSSALVNAIIVMFMYVFPTVLNRGSADWIYSVMMAVLSATVWPIAVSADTILVHANGTWVIALGFSIGFLKPWLNAIWISVINVMACLSLAGGGRNGDGCARADPLRGSLQLSTISVVTVLCLFAVDKLLHQMMQLELEARSSRNELAAAQSVLRSVCDVVGVVDDALRLREDSPALRNLLFLDQRRSLRHEDLRSFLASAEDCAKFDEQMRVATAAGQPSGESPRLSVAFHVSLKDSAGITLEVEVFVVPFLNRENQQSHLVGIREQQSTERTAEPLRSNGRMGPLFMSDMLCEGADERGVADELVRSSSSSSAVALEDSKVSAWVDLLSPNWKMTSVTDAFQTYMRLTEEEVDFLNLVKHDQQERLIDFAQTVTFQQQDRASPATFGEPIFFRSAYMRRLNLCLCASLELDWCPDPSPTSQDMKEVIRMSLGDISWRNHGSRRGPRARGGLRQKSGVLRPSPRPDAPTRLL
ncbi:unnamed protein product [Prorocentrum cordatum]|uniref:Uncharacterized protein n=1 Tax=Prorocentrum cordatum TaxID=2364126 RepID=A0ABN9SLL2_9DINO|nr:unnamed protein product [Polarella glacialis]